MIQPLDFEYIFLNTFAGSTEIFFGIFLIGISVLAGIFRMSGFAFIMMIGLSTMLLYGWFGEGFYIILILITAMLVYWIFSRLIK